MYVATMRHLLNLYLPRRHFRFNRRKIERQASTGALAVYSGVIEECCLLIIIPQRRKNKSLDHNSALVHLGQKKDRKDAVFPSSRTEEATEREREREKKGKRERERERKMFRASCFCSMRST